MTIFITNGNITQFAKVQGANSYVKRDEVVLLWDELDKEGKELAKNIEIDLKVETEDPSSVPDKWNDSVEKVGDTIDTTEIIKMITVNPSRIDVYELLQRENPPEPLVLWWLARVYSDPEYFKRLSDICHYGLFKTDTKFLWSTIAFGVEAGVGRFHWPDSEKDSQEVKSLKKEIAEKHGISKIEVDKLWYRINDIAEQLITEEEPEEVEEEENTVPSTLLDL